MIRRHWSIQSQEGFTEWEDQISNDEYPDAPVKWSLDFDVALTEIPE